MKNPFRNSPPLYLISDTAISGITHMETFRIAIASGVKTIQLREKLISKRELYREAMAIRTLTRRHKVMFIINDYVDIAFLVDADGVHLGQNDMPVKEARKILGKNKIIGVSTHNLKQAVDAQREGADYVGFGPIFYTQTKDAGRPKGISSLKQIRGHIRIPIVAIGGITVDSVLEVMDGGADAVAVISAILRGDIKANIKKFLSLMRWGEGYEYR